MEQIFKLKWKNPSGVKNMWYEDYHDWIGQFREKSANARTHRQSNRDPWEWSACCVQKAWGACGPKCVPLFCFWSKLPKFWTSQLKKCDFMALWTTELAKFRAPQLLHVQIIQWVVQIWVPTQFNTPKNWKNVILGHYGPLSLQKFCSSHASLILESHMIKKKVLPSA